MKIDQALDHQLGLDGVGRNLSSAEIKLTSQVKAVIVSTFHMEGFNLIVSETLKVSQHTVDGLGDLDGLMITHTEHLPDTFHQCRAGFLDPRPDSSQDTHLLVVSFNRIIGRRFERWSQHTGRQR
ncbi:hypothetical protein D3C80_1894830 [compost metagenome]